MLRQTAFGVLFAATLGASCPLAYAANAFHIDQTVNTPIGAPAPEKPYTAETYGKVLSAHIGRFIASSPQWQSETSNGKVMLYFVIDRDGKVMTAQTKEKPAHPKLDKIVIEAAKRSSPVPPVPKEALKNGVNRYAYMIPILIDEKPSLNPDNTPGAPIHTLKFDKVQAHEGEQPAATPGTGQR